MRCNLQELSHSGIREQREHNQRRKLRNMRMMSEAIMFTRSL